MSQTYTVASAKGGVGKTTTVVNLGAILAAADHDVVLIDADIGMANLGTMLGIVPDGPTLHDVLADDVAVDDALYEGPYSMSVMPGSVELDDYGGVDPAALREVLEAFEDSTEYVLVDTSAGLSHDSSLPLALGDETLLVSTPDRASLLDTKKTGELTTRLGGSVAGVAVTRILDSHPSSETVKKLLDANVLAEIPEDDAVNKAATAQEPLETHAPHSPAAKSYRELVRSLTGESIPEPAEPAEPGGGSESTTAESDTESESQREAVPEAVPETNRDADGTESESAEGPISETEAAEPPGSPPADIEPTEDATEGEESTDVDTTEEPAPADSAAADSGEDESSSEDETTRESDVEERPSSAAASDDDSPETPEPDDSESGSIAEAIAEAESSHGSDPSTVGETAEDDRTDEGRTEITEADSHTDDEVKSSTTDEEEDEKGGFLSWLLGR